MPNLTDGGSPWHSVLRQAGASFRRMIGYAPLLLLVTFLVFLAFIVHAIPVAAGIPFRGGIALAIRSSPDQITEFCNVARRAWKNIVVIDCTCKNTPLIFFIHSLEGCD